MFDTEAISEWVLGNLYLVGGAVGATLLITLAVLLLMVRRRKQERPSIERTLGPPQHDATAQGYVDPDRFGQMEPLGGFELDDFPGSAVGSTPGSTSGPPQPPTASPPGLQEPLPPEEAAPSREPAATGAAAAVSPFANTSARPAASTSGDHVRKVVAGLLEGQGDFSGPEMRRLELLRPEKVLQAIDELEPTISGRNKGLALARLAKIRQHAQLLATGAPIPHPDLSAEPSEIAEATPPQEPAWQEPAWQEPAWQEPSTEPTTEQVWPEPVLEPAWQEQLEQRPEEQPEEHPEVQGWQEPVAEPPAESPVEPAWQEPVAEPPAESPVEPAWQEPVAEPPADPVWQEGSFDEKQEHPTSWQHSLTPPPTEADAPLPYSVIPEAEGTPPTEPVFQRSAPRNDSHWLPSAPPIPSTPDNEPPDDALEPPAAPPQGDRPATTEPLSYEPTAPPREPIDVVIDEPVGEIEQYEQPILIPDRWDVDDGLASTTHAGSSAESPEVGGVDAREREARAVQRSDEGVEQESRALETSEVSLEPLEVSLETLEVSLETAEDVLALDTAEQTDALAFLIPSELGRVFTATTDKQLKLSVIDLLAHQGTAEAMNALEVCLDDPDAEVQLYALHAAERLLREA